MGNRHAADAASVVIQHPGGKVEHLYGAATAAEAMRGNLGRCVELVVLRVWAVNGGRRQADAEVSSDVAGSSARITKVKLLKPKDTLLLGQVYRLITVQEVTKALRARKNEKMQRCEAIRQQHEQLRGGDSADRKALPTRNDTGEEAGTDGRRCRASPRPRARAAVSLNPPPASATDRKEKRKRR